MWLDNNVKYLYDQCIVLSSQFIFVYHNNVLKKIKIDSTCTQDAKLSRLPTSYWLE